ncbi:hypothetical protein [Sphingomonas profundi]|uniref:hypothetical protein n=1 Tax=Alterirhizorhabdus profundi TaxID=2681549 RepID=UPI0018D145E5|nr:hypothetical protein [Sphingomonas profundi]
MPVFRSIIARLRHRLLLEGNVTIHLRADARTARYALPLIRKLLADDEDGETYRCAIAHWHHMGRPPLERYLGSVSLCQIDGPLQDAPAAYSHGWFLPLGGLIETPGVTAHLTPFDADAIRRRIQDAIEREIVGWATEHALYDSPPVVSEYDRASADRAAKDMIADWKEESTSRPDGCCLDEPAGAMCAACRKGSDHD